MNCQRRPGGRSRWLRVPKGPAPICSAPSGCGRPAGVSPAKCTGRSTAGTWMAASPATTCPTLPRIHLWRPWLTWEDPGGVFETEFETEKSDVGLDEYEARTWAGWHHHVAICLVAGAFLLSLQQAWGEKDAADHPAPGVPGGSRDAAPGAVRAR